MASTRFYGEQNVPGAPGQSFIPNMNTTGAPVGYTPQFTGSIGYGDPMQQAGNASTFYGGPQLGNMAGISFDIGEGHGSANKGAKMFNKTRNNPSTNEVEMIKKMLGGPQLPQAMQTGGTMPGQPGNMAFEVAGGNFLDPRSWISGEADKQIDAARQGTYQGSGKEGLADQLLKKNSNLQNMINQM